MASVHLLLLVVAFLLFALAAVPAAPRLPRQEDDDAIVILRWKDWVDLHGRS